MAFYRTVHIRGRWHVAVAVFLRSFQSRLFATGVVAARHGIGGDGGLAQLTPVWRCRSRCMWRSRLYHLDDPGLIVEVAPGWTCSCRHRWTSSCLRSHHPTNWAFYRTVHPWPLARCRSGTVFSSVVSVSRLFLPLARRCCHVTVMVVVFGSTAPVSLSVAVYAQRSRLILTWRSHRVAAWVNVLGFTVIVERRLQPVTSSNQLVAFYGASRIRGRWRCRSVPCFLRSFQSCFYHWRVVLPMR